MEDRRLEIVKASEPGAGATDQPRRWRIRAGLGAWGISCILWTAVLGVPFLPVSGTAKWWTVLVMLVVAEVFFFGGAALLGPEMVRKIKARFWRKRKTDPAPGGAPPLEIAGHEVPDNVADRGDAQPHKEHVDPAT
ncbi:MAG: transporter suffix domain-containing protein [Planctomycetes bacterium]|nr:transporter suffix domain-containing protein [Planctomycetota bacterium]